MKSEFDNVLQLLSLSRISKQAVSGEDASEKAIRNGTAALVLISSDASSLTRKKFHDKCQFYQVDIIDVPFTMEQMGQKMGQSPRSSVTILSEGLAQKIKLGLSQLTGEKYSGSN